MTDPNTDVAANPASPAPISPGGAPAPIPVPLTKATPAAATPSGPSTPTAKRVDRFRLHNILTDKTGAALFRLSVQDAQGLSTALPKDVIPGWSSSDPNVAITPDKDGLKATVSPGKVTYPVTGLLVTAKATLPDGTVVSIDNAREPLNVVATDTGYAMEVAR